MAKTTGREELIALGFTPLTKTTNNELSFWRKIDEDGEIFELVIRHSDGGFTSNCEGERCLTSPKTALAIIHHAKDMGFYYE